MGCLERAGLWLVGLACSSCALHLQSEDAEAPQQVDPSLQEVSPIVWVHVPKTGTSFLNMLAHVPGVCPGIGDNTTIMSDASVVDLLRDKFRCNASVLDMSPARLMFHKPIGASGGDGRFMTMVRQPEERMVSHFNEQMEEGDEFEQLWKLDEEFTKWNSGLMAKMLTRDNFYPWCAPKGPKQCADPPTEQEVQRARLRLQANFSFIGLTEEWRLSMCLFNRMFHQPCRSLHFMNLNPTNSTLKPTMVSGGATALRGYRDPYDTVLYHAALEVFEANLRKHKVTYQSCEPCWREARLM